MPTPDLKTRLSAIAVVLPVPAPADGQPAPAPQPAVIDTAHAARGYDLDVTVAPERVVEAARLMDEAGYMLEAVTGVDWLADQQFEVVYDYTLVSTGERVAIRARIPRATPDIPTISTVFPGADWHERETHDFFGIVFQGHPHLIPLLLPEDATFHPLRKDFGA